MDAIAITENAGGGSNDRPSEIALTNASGQNWRPSANKICILINQGEATLAQEVGQYQTASQMNNAGIVVNTITTPYWPGGAFNAESSEINGKTALAGGGSHQEILSDGTADNNGGTVLLPDAILDLVDDVCPPPDGTYRCAKMWCGSCNCVPQELCVDVTNMTTLESCTGTIPFTGDLCNGLAVSPEWGGSIACTPSGSMAITIALQRGEYDVCEVIGTINGTVGEDSLEEDLPAADLADCATMSAVLSVTSGYDEYQVVIRSLDCGECETEICLECCDSVPPSPPATLVCRITLGTVTQPDDPEPPFDTSCWTDLEFNIAFLYDVDEDTENVCANSGSTRRADCIGNLIDSEFDESCCTGGQWIGGGSNACGDIDVCLVPCGTLICGTPPPGETLTSWDLHMSVGGGNCSEGKQCLICHDDIAWSVEGFNVCGGQLFTVGTGSVTLQVDITEN